VRSEAPDIGFCFLTSLFCSGLSSTPKFTTSQTSRICIPEAPLFCSTGTLVRCIEVGASDASTDFVFKAGKDATEAFYGLHRHDVITRPQYARLQIGTIEGEKSVIHGRVIGELSNVPYAEPTWLADGFHSSYYTEARHYCLITSTFLLISCLAEPPKFSESSP